ncbi:MAG TPA: HAD family hydrolase, partial [Nitrospira sp.]
DVFCRPCLLRECPIDHRCMTGVSVDQVYEAAVKGLSPRGTLNETPSSRTDDAVPGSPGSLPPTGQASLEGVTVFLDRDGTLNVDPGYLKSPADVQLLPGVAAGLARLKSAGAKLIVVTNQSGVGRGLFSLKDLEAVHARLQGLLEQEEAVLDAIYFCPHHPNDGCRCRKPGRGMVDRAVTELQLDLKRSYLIGDHARDMQLAKSVGAKAILFTTGVVDEQAREALRAQQALPDMIATSMTEAVEWILKDAGKALQLSAAGHPR